MASLHFVYIFATVYSSAPAAASPLVTHVAYNVILLILAVKLAANSTTIMQSCSLLMVSNRSTAGQCSARLCVRPHVKLKYTHCLCKQIIDISLMVVLLAWHIVLIGHDVTTVRVDSRCT